MWQAIRRPFLFTAMAMALAACGGSDDNNPGNANSGIQSPPILPPASTGVTVDAAAAWRQYLTTPRRWQVSGQQNANAFTLALVLTPGPVSTFPYNGQLAQTTTESLRLSFAGVANADVDGTLFYTNDSLIGIVGGGTRCAVIRTPFTPLPNNSSVGGKGTIVSLDSLDGCTPTAARVGTVTLTWSIEQDLAVTLFCLTTLRQDPSGIPVGTETACVQSNAAGELGGGARLTLRRADGTEISGKNY